LVVVFALPSFVATVADAPDLLLKDTLTYPNTSLESLKSCNTTTTTTITNMGHDHEGHLNDNVEDRRNRLPSFTEVLSRRTRPPVDLFMF
jgi:hypothetical protein